MTEQRIDEAALDRIVERMAAAISIGDWETHYKAIIREELERKPPAPQSFLMVPDGEPRIVRGASRDLYVETDGAIQRWTIGVDSVGPIQCYRQVPLELTADDLRHAATKGARQCIQNNSVDCEICERVRAFADVMDGKGGAA